MPRGTVVLLLMLALVAVVCAAEAPAGQLSPLSHRGMASCRSLHAASLPTSAREPAFQVASEPAQAILASGPSWLLAQSIDHPPRLSA